MTLEPTHGQRGYARSGAGTTRFVCAVQLNRLTGGRRVRLRRPRSRSERKAALVARRRRAGGGIACTGAMPHRVNPGHPAPAEPLMAASCGRRVRPRRPRSRSERKAALVARRRRAGGGVACTGAMPHRVNPGHPAPAEPLTAASCGRRVRPRRPRSRSERRAALVARRRRATTVRGHPRSGSTPPPALPARRARGCAGCRPAAGRSAVGTCRSARR